MKYCLVMPKLTQIDDQSYSFPIGIAYVSSTKRRQTFLRWGKTGLAFYRLAGPARLTARFVFIPLELSIGEDQYTAYSAKSIT